jgi:PIN domain nuclease of toxin-antitoxin system
VNILLDTHVLLWALSAPQRISPRVVRALEAPTNRVVVSTVSAIEIAIKQSLDKIDLPGPAESWLEPALLEVGFETISLDFRDALLLRTLPWHHRDPFDRLLIAQAMRGYTLCTHDERIQAYGIKVLRA